MEMIWFVKNVLFGEFKHLTTHGKIILAPFTFMFFVACLPGGIAELLFVDPIIWLYDHFEDGN